jgi:hypothetical protein
MNNGLTPTTQPLDLAKEQLKYEKLTTQLLTRQQMIDESLRHSSKIRWQFIFIAVSFFLFSRYIVLRTQFKQVFNIFKNSKKIEGLECLSSSNLTAWNLVLNVSYPWIGRTLIEQPLSQDQAEFLWLAIRSNWLPTQDQIDGDECCSALDLSPLSYLCGDIYTEWNKKTGKSYSDIRGNPEQTPWKWFLSSDSKILQSDDLITLVTTGLGGIARLLGTEKSPQDMYNEIYTKSPPAKGCNGSSQAATYISSTMTGMMAGGALGPGGALAGGVGGVVLGFVQSSGQCGDKSGCNVM